MDKFIIILLSFFIFSCSSFQTQEQIDNQEIIGMLKGQRVLAILHKNVGDVDIPTEYYLSDVYMVVDGLNISIYNYSNLLIKTYNTTPNRLSEILKSLNNK
jgi:hypothetical protein